MKVTYRFLTFDPADGDAFSWTKFPVLHPSRELWCNSVRDRNYVPEPKLNRLVDGDLCLKVFDMEDTDDRLFIEALANL